MVRERTGVEQFRTTRKENVFVLTVTIIKDGAVEKECREVVDAYRGELGDRYAENMLFRMANHILAGTVYEKKPWEIDRITTSSVRRKVGFFKRADGDARVTATVIWHERLENNYLSCEDKWFKA